MWPSPCWILQWPIVSHRAKLLHLYPGHKHNRLMRFMSDWFRWLSLSPTLGVESFYSKHVSMVVSIFIYPWTHLGDIFDLDAESNNSSLVVATVDWQCTPHQIRVAFPTAQKGLGFPLKAPCLKRFRPESMCNWDTKEQDTKPAPKNQKIWDLLGSEAKGGY